MFLAWPRTQMVEYSDGANRCYCCLGSLPTLPTWLGEPGKLLCLSFLIRCLGKILPRASLQIKLSEESLAPHKGHVHRDDHELAG